MLKPKEKNGAKVLTALLTSLPEKRAELRQALDGLRRSVGQESGCIECVVGEEVPNGPRFILMMVWKDLHSLEAHLESTHFKILRGAMNVLSAPAEFRVVSADARDGVMQ